MKNIRVFYLKIFSFLVGKLSIYLNRRVFVMGIQLNYFAGEKRLVSYLMRHVSRWSTRNVCIFRTSLVRKNW